MRYGHECDLLSSSCIYRVLLQGLPHNRWPATAGRRPMPGALASIWNFRFPYDFICMIPNPDFEDFARDYIQLARHEQSPQRRSQLLILAREWACRNAGPARGAAPRSSR